MLLLLLLLLLVVSKHRCMFLNRPLLHVICDMKKPMIDNILWIGYGEWNCMRLDSASAISWHAAVG
jgi:hypothetical protein